MKDELKSKIMRNIRSLKMDMDARQMTDYFLEKEIFDFNDVDKINSYNPDTRENRNNCFFQIIIKKDDNAFDVFLEALRKNGLDHLADQMNNTQVGDEKAAAGDPGAFISEIPEQVRTRRLSDRDLSKLAQCVGKDWEMLATELGLTKVEIDHCMMDNQTVIMQIYAALSKWRGKVAKKGNLENLVEALVTCSCTTVDWGQIERLSQKMAKDG